MVEYFAKWRSELDQPAKVAASEGYEGYGVPMAVESRWWNTLPNGVPNLISPPAARALVPMAVI